MKVDVITKHMERVEDIAKTILDEYDTYTSVIVSHRIEMSTGGDEKLISTLKLLPSKRWYKSGDKFVDDDYILKEILS